MKGRGNKALNILRYKGTINQNLLMTPHFTPEDIVRYLYAEMEESDSIQLMEWLLSDSEAMNLFEELSASKKQMSRLSHQPYPSTLRKCISYSHRLALQAHSF